MYLRAAAVVMLVACGGSPTDETGAGGSGGAPEVGCAPGEVPLAAGGCRPPGVPADGCGEGFLQDGRGACDAILPASACTPGSMATVGETTCREVAPCGAAPWGDVPIEPGAQFVDAGFTGVSTGSETAPWITVQKAIDAASGMVVIAEGDYAESVTITTPVKLWGRCPALVSVRGNGLDPVITVVGTGGVEIHTLAVTAGYEGVQIAYGDALLDRIRVHDTADVGVGVQLGTAVLDGVLVEQATRAGIAGLGAAVTVGGSVVRNILPGGSIGRGEAISVDKSGTERGSLSLSRSLLEGSIGTGAFVVGSDADIDSTLVRGTQALANGTFGLGALINDASDSDPANVTIRRSVFEQNTTMGIFVGASRLTLDGTTVRDTKPQPAPHPSGIDFGFGITVQDHLMTGQRSQLNMTSCAIERNEGVGVELVGSDATIEATVVRDILPQASDGRLGRGINAQPNPGTLQQPTLTLRHAAVERVIEVGIAVAGAADFRMESVAVRDVQPQPADATLGRGITIQDDAATGHRTLATLLDVAVERTFEGGIFVISSDATIDELLVADTAPRASDGAFGDGIVVMSFASTANATLGNTQIARSLRAGVSNFGASVAIEGATSDCNPIHLDGELYQGTKEYRFDDRGSNRCGCAEAFEPCKVVSSNLAPPDPLGAGPGL